MRSKVINEILAWLDHEKSSLQRTMYFSRRNLSLYQHLHSFSEQIGELYAMNHFEKYLMELRNHERETSE